MTSKFAHVYQGGGARGNAYIGMRRAFDKTYGESGWSTPVLVGTSAGAINAALTATGYTTPDFYSLATERNKDGEPIFSEFMDVPTSKELLSDVKWSALEKILLATPFLVPPIRSLYSLTYCGGLFSGDHFHDWLTHKFAKKGFKNPTLRSLFHDTGTELHLLASDVVGMRSLLLNHASAPDLYVADAVRMSMSIPFVWQEVVWNKSRHGKYLGEDLSGTRIYDGGVFMNFALPVISTMQKQDTKRYDSLAGFVLDATLPIPNLPPPSSSSAVNKWFKDVALKSDTVSRLYNLMHALLKYNDAELVRANPDVVCRLPVKAIGTLEFDLPQDRLDALLSAAEIATSSFLARHPAP